jgi:hypothetical protein
LRDIFPAYYRQDEQGIKTLWDEALIVLDANVLLNLYRYRKQTRDDLIALLKHVGDRLIVPYQAALEYQRNRLNVISNQKGRFDEVRKVLTDVEQRLTSELTKLQLQKRHSSISPESLIDEVGKALAKFREELSSHESSHFDVFDDDPIRTVLDALLDGKIGPLPSQQKLDAIYTDGKLRYAEGRPPGYKDESKAKGEQSVYFSDGLRIERSFGDLILWNQIMELAAEKKVGSLILVTDDEKQDWWWIVESKGQKTIGPRIELSEEIRATAGVTNFAMYSSERFMQSAKHYLGVDVDQSSIDELGEVREEAADREHIKYGILVENAIARWISTTLKGRILERGNEFPDFRLRGKDGSIVGCEAISVSRRKVKLLDGSLFLRHRLISEITTMVYIFVARSPTSAEGVKEEAKQRLLEIPSDVTLVIGYLDFSQDRMDPSFRSTEVLEGELKAL